MGKQSLAVVVGPGVVRAGAVEGLGLFADQAAVAIENARLHGAAVRRGKELEALLRATRSVMGELDLQQILDRIVTEGYAEASGEQIVDGRLRRYYRLTDAGGEALAAETARLQAIARRAHAVLRARPAGELGFTPRAAAGSV